MKLNKILKLYEFAQIGYLFWKKESHSKTNANLFDKVSLVKRGFHGESKIIYQLTRDNYMKYLSDYKRLKAKFINRKYSFLLNNKITFEKLFKDHISIPKSLSLITKGNIVPLESEVKDFNSLINYLNENTFAVMKPIVGGGGNGILILKMIDGTLYANNKEIDLLNLISRLDEYFISEFIEQGKFAEKLYPATLNSMRIVTMIDPHTNKAFIPIAVQRIGTNKSAPSDNWTQGAISAEIDIATGVMKKGASYPIDGEIIWHETHPDSNNIFAGLKIPEWEKTKNLILELANKHPYIKYVGWDVVQTDRGVMIIEGNNCTDMNLLQIHRPLLEDDRVRNFYKYHGVL